MTGGFMLKLILLLLMLFLSLFLICSLILAKECDNRMVTKKVKIK